jgi:hypothetical protein
MKFRKAGVACGGTNFRGASVNVGQMVQRLKQRIHTSIPTKDIYFISLLLPASYKVTVVNINFTCLKSILQSTA